MDRCAFASVRQCRRLFMFKTSSGSSSRRASKRFSSIPETTAKVASSPSSVHNESKPPTPPSSKEVKIPFRIDRSSTDILKALANTVSRDYTAPHYKYHDDPYLIPSSHLAKRTYALSKDSGRRAAKWVREQQPELYYDKNAEPAIMSYLPDPTLANAPEVTEETVISLIHLGLLAEAVKGYEMLKEKGAEISLETREALLEMLAFYNEIEPGDEDLIEERWFKQGFSSAGREFRNTWKSNGTAEAIFAEMESPDARAYCALIRGRAKFMSTDKAFALYQEALSKGIALDVETFNAILSSVNYIQENAESRWDLVKVILMEMSKRNVQPNIGTLNACLESVCFIGVTRIGKEASMQVLAEFRELGIQPSLGSYYYLLSCFCKERGPTSTILVDIMNEIEGKEFSIQHPKDTYFFTIASEVCRRHLRDLKLFDRVHQFLLTGKNYDLIGDSFREQIYYRNFMYTRISSEPLENFFEFYEKIVPNVYTPEPSVMEEILKAIQLNGAISYAPQIWSDMIVFDHNRRENVLALLLQIIADDYPARNTAENVQLGSQLAAIAWKIFMQLENQNPELSNYIYWTGKMLGDILTVLLKSEELDKAGEIMKKLVTPKQKIVGVASIDSLKLFLETFIKANKAPYCLACVQYANEAGYPEVAQMAEDVFARVTLDSVQTARLNTIVGFDVSAALSKTSRS